MFAVPTTSIVLPVFVKPAPAEIWPAPENCSKVILVVPSVGVPFVVRTKPLSAFAVPSSTKVNAPPVSSEAASASGVLVRTNAAEPEPTVVTL